MSKGFKAGDGHIIDPQQLEDQEEFAEWSQRLEQHVSYMLGAMRQSEMQITVLEQIIEEHYKDTGARDVAPDGVLVAMHQLQLVGHMQVVLGIRTNFMQLHAKGVRNMPYPYKPAPPGEGDTIQ